MTATTTATETARHQAIAEEIARQIGGRRAFAMMGTKNRFFDGPALQFDVRGSWKWNKVRVQLDPCDTYTVTFYKIGRAPAFKVTQESFSDIYGDQLKGLIERETGLYLSL